ncbi:hypothetical protein ACFL2P_04110 [Candidatus Moduliflexota bacterium]
MKDRKVTVIAYAGSRGEESPRAFFRGGERVEVEKVLRAWVGEEEGNRERRRFFRVKGSDGGEYLLFYDEGMGEWFTREKLDRAGGIGEGENPV